MTFTLAIIKPDAAANPIALKWISTALARHQLTATKGCRVRLNSTQAHELYSAHRNKFFYARLIRHVCSGTSIIMRLETDEELNRKKINSGFLPKLKKFFNPPRECDRSSTTAEDVAIKRWRTLLGPAKLFANLHSLRGALSESNLLSMRLYFSLSDTRNIAHGSDSLVERDREYRIFEDLLTDIDDMEFQLFELDRFCIPPEKERLDFFGEVGENQK